MIFWKIKNKIQKEKKGQNKPFFVSKKELRKIIRKEGNFIKIYKILKNYEYN